jgi:hypothetical protein
VTDSTLDEFISEATNQASDCRMGFYLDFKKYHDISKTFFFTNSLVGRCKKDVLPYLEQNQDHGIEHGKKVAIDAGTLILVEGRGWDPKQIKQWSLLAQLAGLMHDMYAPTPDHARQGAATARQILSGYPLLDVEKEAVVFAIEHHENLFEDCSTLPPVYQWVRNALHDADKFRWSLDHLRSFFFDTNPEKKHWTIQDMWLHLPGDITSNLFSALTFKTGIGQRYGPQFVHAGLAIREHLHQHLCDQIVPEKPRPHPSHPDHSL